MIGWLKCLLRWHDWIPVTLQVSRPPRNPKAGEYNIHDEIHLQCTRCYVIRFRHDPPISVANPPRGEPMSPQDFRKKMAQTPWQKPEDLQAFLDSINDFDWARIVAAGYVKVGPAKTRKEFVDFLIETGLFSRKPIA